MFSVLIGHRPLYRSQRKKVGKLFTPAVTVALVLLLVILFSCIFASVLAPMTPTPRT